MPRALTELPWPLHTERLALRPARSGDLDEFWRMRSLPGVSEWLSMGTDDRAAFDERYGDPKRLAHTLTIELDGAIVGDLMIRIHDAWAQYEIADQAAGVQAELGWVLDPAHQGHGYATEAVAAAMAVCFDGLDLRRVTAGCFADNEASWRLMERLGMRREVHTIRESLHRSGRWLDGYEYAILADEWTDRPFSP